jgi:phosphoglycolate phosphatase/pyrophosphatase PpaX
MALRYRCLFIDHDDTAVDSSKDIHYPAHVEALRQLRPERTIPSLEQWYEVNFHPGIGRYLKDDLALAPPEMTHAYHVWRQYCTTRTPQFFPGFLQALRDYRDAGGAVVVVSHSEADIIRRHYREVGFEPFRIFGWDEDEQRRKPAAYPVTSVLKELGLAPAQALIVDDLRPAVEMSRATGVPVAAAGWSHQVPQIQAYMREHCTAFFETVAEFAGFILQEA